MATVTNVLHRGQRRPNWRLVFLDGRYAFGATDDVLDEFKVREGMKLSDKQIEEIRLAELRHECMEQAASELARRPQSTVALRRRLLRMRYGPEAVEAALKQLKKQGVLDDEKMARQIAAAALREELWERPRASEELLRRGFDRDLSERVVEDLYDGADTAAMALKLAQKLAPRVRRDDAVTARRRLWGALYRRGFGNEEISAALDKVLGPVADRE